MNGKDLNCKNSWYKKLLW